MLTWTWIFFFVGGFFFCVGMVHTKIQDCQSTCGQQSSFCQVGHGHAPSWWFLKKSYHEKNGVWTLPSVLGLLSPSMILGYIISLQIVLKTETITRVGTLIMPSKKEIIDVICIYILENNLHPKMRKYIMTVLEHGKLQEELTVMTKEELWGLVAYYAEDLQKTFQTIGGLQ